MGLTREQRASRTDACVYFIRDPFTLRIVYIGASTNPRARLNQHVGCPYSNLPLRNWAKSVIAQGKRPLLQIVFSGLTMPVAERVEHRLIVLHSGNGLLQKTYRFEFDRYVRNGKRVARSAS